MEQVEYPVMSGGNTISVATVLLETGMLPMQEPVTEFQLEAPAGLIGINPKGSPRTTACPAPRLPWDWHQHRSTVGPDGQSERKLEECGDGGQR